jgi:hypothetical protein
VEESACPETVAWHGVDRLSSLTEVYTRHIYFLSNTEGIYRTVQSVYRSLQIFCLYLRDLPRRFDSRADTLIHNKPLGRRGRV